MLPGAIYCRVSTDEQLKDWMGLPYQKDSCLKFAKDNSLIVPENHIFLESYSGGYLERPQLDKLRALARQKKIGFVIFPKRDRVARDQFAYHTVMKDLADASVRVYFSEEKLTGDLGIDSFMGSTIVWFAQWEREQIKLRTNAGKRQHAKSWKWPFGHVPYGYTKNPKTRELEIFKPEEETLKQIVGWYLKDSLTLWAIAHKLVENGTLPPSMSEKEGPNQRANQKNLRNSVFHWSATTVQRILSKASIYTGIYQAFQKQYKKTEGNIVCLGERPKEEWIEIPIPAIITVKQAEAVLEKLESNRRFAKKRSVREYMLQGKLRCSCQSEYPHFSGYFNNTKELRNYRCNMNKADKVSEERRCSNHISGLKIESVVVDTLKELMLEPDNLFMFASDRQAEAKGDIPKEEMKDRYNELHTTIFEIKDKRERAEDLFVDGRIKKDRLDDILERLDKEEEKISKEMNKEMGIIKSSVLKEDAQRLWTELMTEEREYIEQFFEEATYEDIKDLMGIVLEKVVLTTEKKDKVARMVFRLPVTPAFEARYMEDKKIEYDDDEGNTHVVGVIPNSPVLIPLDPTKAPIAYRTVEFLPNGDEGWDENKTDTPDSPQVREEKRLIRLLRQKYCQVYEYDQFW